MKFPNETEAYRQQRDELLKQEQELLLQLTRVAEQRAQLPPGGEVPQDYEFEGRQGPVKLSQLFDLESQSLLVYNLMYGPKMKDGCPSCSSLVDGFNAICDTLRPRVPIVVVARNPLPKILELAERQGWNRIRLLSSEKNSYNLDYGGENAEGDQMPMLNTFVRKAGKIHHFWGSEMLYRPAEKGRDPRHVDLVWPLWQLLDLTAEGRGTSWYPVLRSALTGSACCAE